MSGALLYALQVLRCFARRTPEADAFSEQACQAPNLTVPRRCRNRICDVRGASRCPGNCILRHNIYPPGDFARRQDDYGMRVQESNQTGSGVEAGAQNVQDRGGTGHPSLRLAVRRECRDGPPQHRSGRRCALRWGVAKTTA